MITANNVSGLADLSEAAYLDFGSIPTGGLPGEALKARLAINDGAWPQARRDTFALHWKVAAYQPNTGSGFSATVFERINPQPGEPLHVVAMRGTEGNVMTQLFPDLLSADLSDLVANGLAWKQIMDMHNWWHQVTAPLGASFDAVGTVSISTGAALARIAAGYTDVIVGVSEAWQIVHTQSTLTGLGLLSPAEQVDVTGHSLGGNLATAFSRIFSGNTSNVLTINGAGYSSLGTATGNTNRVFAELGGQATFDASRILNLYGDRGLNIVTQDVALGLKQPGAHEPVFLENSSVGNTVGHGAGQMAHSLNVYEMYRRLEGVNAPTSPAAMVSRYRPMLDASASDDDWSFERAVDSMRRLLLGGTEVPTAKGDLATFFDRLASLEASAAYMSLSGKVSFTLSSDDLVNRARTDFSALASLITLSPVVITATSAANQAVLDTTLQGVWGSDFTHWQDDKNMSQAERNAGRAAYTDTWLKDRSLLLSGILTANQQNAADSVVAGNLLFGQRLQTSYVSHGVTQQLLFKSSRGDTFLSPVSYLCFGGDQADFLVGGNLDDRLYGGGGMDQVNAGDGDDYVEGGAEFDSLYGEKGNDTLLGGAGADALDGGAGNDSLLGGQGLDTYTFTAGWRVDTVLDSDGQGSIQVLGLNPIDGSGAAKVDEGVWQTADKQYNYTLVPVAAGRNDLYITFADRPDVIIVRDWSPSKNVGITLSDTITVPATDTTKVGTTNGDVRVGSYTGGDTNPSPGFVFLKPATEVIASDRLVGAQGNDELFGYLGNDVVDGGAGNDLLAGGYGNDIILGGDGDDVVLPDEVSNANPGWEQVDTTVAPPGAGQGLYYAGYTLELFGAGSTWLLSSAHPGAVSDGILIPDNTPGRDQSDDLIDAGAGADLVFAGIGQDIVLLGDGNDIAFGQGGRDILLGGIGNDLVFGDGNLQYINDGIGYAAGYTAASDHGDDLIDGGDGNDTLYGGGGADIISGGIGDDVISGDGQYFTDPSFNIPVSLQGDDYVDGGDGVDSIYGFAGADTLLGGNGNDFLFGDYSSLDVAYHGNDSLDGGEGDDRLEGMGGDDTLIGGNGSDSLYGGSGNDVLNGGAGFNVLDGGTGDDTLVAQGYSDTLTGGAGHDRYVVDTDWGATISETVLSADDTDVLVLGAINADAVGLTHSGRKVTLYATGAGPVTFTPVTKGMPSSIGIFSSVEFADGGIWTWSDLRAAIQGTATEGNDELYGFDGESNTLSGLGGDDHLYGLTGNDTYDGGAGNDVITDDGGDDLYLFGRGDGQDRITNYANSVYGPQGASQTDVIRLRSGVSPSDVLLSRLGGDLRVSISGTSDKIFVTDFFAASTTADQIIDRIEFEDGQVSITAAQIRDLVLVPTDQGEYIEGYETDDYLRGAGGDDFLAGVQGNDTLDGGSGNDVLSGGTGDNVFLFGKGGGQDYIEYSYQSIGYTNTLRFDASVAPSEVAVRGSVVSIIGTQDRIDTHSLFGTYTLAANMSINRVEFADGTVWTAAQLYELSKIATVGDDSLYGSFGDDSIDGLDGNDTLYAGVGVDTLSGGDGGDSLYGEDGDDVLSGGGGNDALDGGAGNDTLDGGLGNDNYLLGAGDGADVIVEAVVDTAASKLNTLTFKAGVLASNVNAARSGTSLVLSMAGTTDKIEIRDFFATDGTVGANSPLQRVSFADGTVWDTTAILAKVAGGGSLTLVGTAGADTLSGGRGNDTLSSLAGNDRLDGGAGADSMSGGAGNDTYVVDNVGDVVTERAFDGTDTVESSVTWTLGNAQDHLTLTGSGAINGTGNSLANTIRGNAGDNVLSGGTNNDTLIGGAGSDTLIGGTGNDTFVVDAVTDVVIENANEGTDLVQSSATWTLSANVENLTLTGTAAINGTGNTLANTLTGNGANNMLVGDAGNDSLNGGSGDDVLNGGSGNDTLYGGSGSDTMLGGTGDDIYSINVATDVVTEYAGEGIDTVQVAFSYALGANVENLTLTSTYTANGAGNELDNVLLGNRAVNTLTGGAGNDTLDGAAGTDTLVGGTGADRYLFGRGYGVDTIQENDSTAGITDVVQFGSGIVAADLIFSHVGNNLEVAIAGTSDKVVVQNWYLGTQYRVEQFKLADGTIVSDTQVPASLTARPASFALDNTTRETNLLIDAMAAFNAPAAGSSSVPLGWVPSRHMIMTGDLAASAMT